MGGEKLGASRWLGICALALGAIALSGCALFSFRPDRSDALTGFETYGQADLANDLKSYEKTDATLTERTSIRNRIVYRVASTIDHDYENFANGFFVEQGYVDTALDAALIGMGSAGALAGGVALKAALAAASAGTSGARASFAKNFFKEKGPEVIRARMNALRAKQWLLIYKKLEKNADDYSIYEAGRDLAVYYNCGTVKAAFDDIVAESGNEKQDADGKLEAEIQSRFGVLVREPDDRPGFDLIVQRNSLLQHGKVDRNGTVVDIGADAAPGVACDILKEYDAAKYGSCTKGLSELRRLLTEQRDRTTTQRLNDAYVAVVGKLP